MQLRFDTAPISKIEVEPESGFLHVREVPIARVGVFPYQKADGSTDMEAKLPQYLLADSTVDSANGKPVTDNHPPVMLNSKNVKEYMGGYTASNAHVKNDTLYVDLYICDEDLIKDISNGKEELSIGFRTELQKVAGEFNGTKYDSVQSNIQINHVAVVDKGRAGHSIRLTGDSASMVITDDETGQNSEDKMSNVLKQVLLDGNTITIDEKDADVVAKTNQKLTTKDAQIAQWKKQIEDLKKKIKDAEDGNGSETNEESEKTINELKQKADSLEKEKKELADSLDSKVEQRVSLIDSAKSYLPSDYDFKGKSDREIKVDSIKSVKKDFNDTDMDDNTVNGIYTALGWTHKTTANDSSTGYAGQERKNDNSNTGTQTVTDSQEDDQYDAIFNKFNGGNN